MYSEAAFHEAGHAVVAHASAFHALGTGSTSLAAYGAGAVDVALSSAKLRAAGLPQNAGAALLPEVARSLAIVLAAGLAAEKLAAQDYQQLVPNPGCAAEDHLLLLQCTTAAGIDTQLATYEAEAARILRDHWGAVLETARMLERVRTISNADLWDCLDSWCR